MDEEEMIVDSAALAEKRRQHREEFKRNLSGEEILVSRLRETRRLLAAAEERANLAEAELCRESKDAGPLERYVAVVEATKIAAVSTLRSELEVCRCNLAVSAIKRAAAEARCADLEDGSLMLSFDNQLKSASPSKPRGTTSSPVVTALEKSERRIKALEAQLQTRDARVSMLEEHLAKMDAHLAALAQGGGEGPELDFEELDKEERAGPIVKTHKQEKIHDDADLRQELALVRAALEGADKAAREAEAKAQAEKTRSEELERSVLASRKHAEERVHAEVAALENAREAEVEASAAREAAGIAQEEVITARQEYEHIVTTSQKEIAAVRIECEESVTKAQEEAEAVRQDCEQKLIKAQEEVTTVRREAEQSVAKAQEETASKQQASALLLTKAQEEVATVRKECERSLDVLNSALDEEPPLSDLKESTERCARFIKEARRQLQNARMEQTAAVEEAEKKAYLNESRADAAEARLETAEIKLEAAQERAETIQQNLREKMNQAEKRATSALEKVSETQSKLEEAEAKLEHAVDNQKLQEEVATSSSRAAKEQLDAIRTQKTEEIQAVRERVQVLKNELTLARDSANTADAVCAALCDQGKRERTSLTEERDLAMARAKAQVERYRQLADDSKEAAAQAYTEAMQHKGPPVPAAPRLPFRLTATLSRCLDKHNSMIDLKRMALYVWRTAAERDCWQQLTTSARGRVAAMFILSLRKARCASALLTWRRVTMPKKIVQSSQAPPNVQQRLQMADRAAATAAGVSAAAKLARYTSAESREDDYSTVTRLPLSQHHSRRGPVLFRRCVDASGGVIGVDGNELCPAYQFGNCQQQHETGLVVHHLPDGGIAWHWHACVACARVTGRLASHPRFASDGQASQCPIAERANDRVYEVLPSDTSVALLPSSTNGKYHHETSYSTTLGADRGPSTSSRLRYQDQCIKSYEKQRTELMSALGTALTSLHNLGATYPHWVWDLYERSRLERYTRFVSTTM